MAIATYTKSGVKSKSAVKLDKDIFKLAVTSHDAMRQVYEANQANSRTNLAHTKTRGEVRGGGRKPWRQKGTGRARFGSIRNPIWRGGGIVFGPRKAVNFKQRTGARLKAHSLKQALSLAQQSERISVIEGYPSSTKTSELASLLAKIGMTKGLLVAAGSNAALKQSANNLAGIKVIEAEKLSSSHVLTSAHILIEKSALAILSKRLEGLK